MKCQNNGTCAYNSTDQAVCVCEIGYTGDYCESKINFIRLSKFSITHLVEEGCANKPCLNGGLCVNINTIDYECECLSIYNGTNCEGNFKLMEKLSIGCEEVRLRYRLLKLALNEIS